MGAKRTLYTVGHSTHSADALISILRSADVTRLVDIRRIPRSRTNPQFNEDVLPGTLAQPGIAYLRIPTLGGRRSQARESAGLNRGWRVKAFENYADYALSATFHEGITELLALARRETCAIMCSEVLWWRCHRRIVTDYVIVRGLPVVHLLSETKHEPAALTPFAVLGATGLITYPGPL